MKRTCTGGCHCGAVRYEADIDFSQGTIRCNCSMCRKSRSWLVAVDVADFRLLRGEDALSKYQFNSNRIEHLFCRTCGVKSFARAAGADGKGRMVVVVSCLDDVPEEELAALKVMYVDGRNDNFRAPPVITSYL